MLQSDQTGFEYSVYGYAWNTDQQWKRHKKTLRMEEALETAEKLHNSKKFQTVEIKKRIRDERRGRTLDITLKQFTHKKKKPWAVISALTLALSAGLTALAIGYYFSLPL